MIRLRPARNVALLLASIFATLSLFASSAQAAVEVDFNGDGVVDPIDVQHAPERIVVHVSGGQPQILTVKERILAIAAADVDRDGHVDITAIAERHGLRVWFGRHGRFKAAAGPAQRRAWNWSRSGRSASPRDGSANPSAQVAGDGSREIVASGPVSGCSGVQPSHRVIGSPEARPSIAFVAAQSTRAPPAFSF